MVTAIATVATVLAAFAIPLMATSASADTPNLPGTIVTTPSSLTGLTNLQNVHFHTAASSGKNIFGVDARICTPTASIVNSADFDATGGNCAIAPLSAGSNNFVQATPPDSANLLVDLDFKVGVGTANLYPVPTGGTITCGSANPCTIWLHVLASPGTGNPTGEYFESFPVTFAAAPGAPTIAQTGTTSTSATIGITPGSGTATSYNVSNPPAGSSVACTVTPAQCVVTGLTAFTTYPGITVTSTNSVGTSPVSNAITLTPGPTGPTNVGAQAGPGKVTVTWNAASGSPTGYTASAVLFSDHTTPTGTPCTTTTALSCDVTGLANGTPVQVIVTATYVGGSIPTSPYPAGGVTPVSNNGAVTQTFTVAVPTGALTIGEACAFTAGQTPGVGGTPGPYGDKPFLGAPQPQNCNVALSAPVLNTGGTGYTSGGTTQEVTVRDLRASDAGWHVTTALTTSFTNGANVIPSCNFGFLPVVAGLGALAPYTQTYGLSEQVAPGCNAANVGAYSSSHTSATANAAHGLGDSTINGPVTLNIPLTSPAGTYTGVMTYTLFPAP